MKTYLQNIFTGLSLVAFTLFMGNGFLVEQVHAQTADRAINTEGTVAVARSEFKDDVEKGLQEVSGDGDAQNNQIEIDNDDSEHAGDEHGDVKEVDGENDQSEIDNEIDQEDATSGQSSDQESGGISSSTEINSSSGVNNED